MLSDKEEAILAAAGEMAASPDDIYSMLNDADLKFPDAVDKDGNKHPVTHGTFIPLMQSYDRVLRKSAFDSLYSVYSQFRNTSAATLSAQLKQLLFFANVRKYPSTLDAALDGNEEIHVRGGQGDRTEGARAARRGLPESAPRGLCKRLDRRVRERGQALGRVLGRCARTPLCAAQLQGHARRRVHARA